MFGYRESPNNSPGARRLGGPIQFKTLWPSLRENLHQVYMANSVPAGLGAATVREVEGAELEVPSFLKAA